MRVLLVNPPDAHKARLPGVSLLLREFVPPLGLLYLKSYLARESKAEVELYNFQLPAEPTLQDFRAFLVSFRPDIVGITANTFYWYDVCRTASVVRETLPAAVLVAGGPHVGLFPEESLDGGGFDVMLHGEARASFAELIERAREGRGFAGLPGAIYRDRGEVVVSPSVPMEGDPDRYPPPERVPSGDSPYRNVTHDFTRTAVVLTSFGCPYRCTFCSNRKRDYSGRRVDRVVDEILACKALGFQSIDVHDPNLCMSRDHVTALCEAMIERRVDLPWVCRARVDSVDGPTLRLMARAGCRRVGFGVESGNQRVLDEVGKGITLEQSRAAIAMCREAGIETVGFYMIGFPGETREEALRTIDFALDAAPDFLALNILLPAPGSDLYDRAIQDPAFGGDYVRSFVARPVPDFVFRPWPGVLSERDLLGLQRRAYLRFYLRPRALARTLRRASRPATLMTKVRLVGRLLAGPRYG